MKISRLPDLLDGERMVAVDPPPAPRVEAGWFRRLHFHTGRHLTDRALTTEQNERAGRLALLGQAAAPGVVQGLEAVLEEVVDGELTSRFLQVFPGVGLALSGEDVLLSRPLRVPLADVPVDAPDLPSATTGVYILVLQPAVAEILAGADLDDPCEIDEESRPFDDEQTVDAARLRLLPWPVEILGAVPAWSATWRNVLAYRIFEYERALAPGTLPPWLAFGVPLGLLALAGADAPINTPGFLDRGTVVRSGGHFQARRSPLLRPVGEASGGNPGLWQARFDQWIEHLSAIDPGLLAAQGMEAAFRLLPPLGVFPPHLMAVRGIEPADDDPLNPLPEGEVDFLPEDGLFPPPFLIEAAPVPLENLDDLQRVASPQAPIDLQAFENIQVLVPVPEAFYDPRLLVIERVDQAFLDAITLYLWRHLDRQIHHNQVVRDIAALVEAQTGQDPVDLPEDPVLPPAPPDADPLEPETDWAEQGEVLISALAARIDALMTPARRAHLFRAMLPGANEPQLTDVVAAIGVDGLIEHLEKLLAESDDQVEMSWFRLRADLHRMNQQLSQNVVGTRLAVSPSIGNLAQDRAPAVTAGSLERFGKVLSDRKTRQIWPEREEEGVPIDRALLPLARVAVPVVSRLASARLEEPLAVETRTGALEAKVQMFNAATTLHTGGIDLSGLQFPGFAREGENDDDPDFPDGQLDFGAAGFSPDKVRAALQRKVYDGVEDPNDEATAFAYGVRSLDSAIVGLRNLDRRLGEYRQVVESARLTITALKTVEDEARKRLEALDDLLAEANHDLVVALALREEEMLRLRALNQKRRQIVNDHVPFLIFRRPLSFEAPVAPPVREVLPGNHRDPLPECLNMKHPVPDALGAMLDLLREAPAGWFRQVPPLLQQLDRLESIQDLLKTSLERAKLPFQPRMQPIEKAATAGSTGKQVQTVFTSQFGVLRDLRVATATFNPLILTWQNAKREAEKRATLGDLMDPRHGRPAVATKAAQELENITRVATCLHERFREIPAIHRLRWIDDISQFDDAVDLRDLSTLEGFSQVGDRYDRSDMQAMVDWLHGRMSSEVKATALMNAVIRVALLVASHAPTHALVTASLVTPRPALVGTRLILELDVSRVRVGMIAQLLPQAGAAVGHGIIEDLSDGVATVRVERAVPNAPLVYKAQIIEPDKAGGFTFSAQGLVPT